MPRSPRGNTHECVKTTTTSSSKAAILRERNSSNRGEDEEAEEVPAHYCSCQQPRSSRRSNDASVYSSSSSSSSSSTLREHPLQSREPFSPWTASRAAQQTLNEHKEMTRNSETKSLTTMNGFRASRYKMLCYEWIVRLDKVLQTELHISSRQPRMPALQMNLQQLILGVKQRLLRDGITVKDIRINGSAASYVFEEKHHEKLHYNDLDLLFGVEFTNGNSLQQIKTAVLTSLTDFMLEYAEGDKSNLSEALLKDAYVQKMVRVNNSSHDSWSLITLGNASQGEKVVEMKFVNRMRRKFEFTVDSFQVILDSMLSFYQTSAAPISKNFYPPVVAESVSGNFEEALHHLRHRLIATRNPEEIRGGGLLKYCKLIVEGYRPADAKSIHILERYMCSRFFIDFSDLQSQFYKLQSYLYNHFGHKEELKVDYLQTLRRVVDKSTVCLMWHERRQTLQLIDYLIEKVVTDAECKTSFIQLDEFNSKHWTLDQVFYGTSYFPQEAYIQYAIPSFVDLDSSCGSSSSASPIDSATTQCAHDVNSSNSITATPTPTPSLSPPPENVCIDTAAPHHHQQDQSSFSCPTSSSF